MLYFDYHQGRIQAYFESTEPSDHRLYVPEKIVIKYFLQRIVFPLKSIYEVEKGIGAMTAAKNEVFIGY